MPQLSVASASVDELVALSCLIRLVTTLGLSEYVRDLVMQYFTRCGEGFKCILCGCVVGDTYVLLLIHLFREHPDKYYRVEEQVLEQIRQMLRRRQQHS